MRSVTLLAFLVHLSLISLPSLRAQDADLPPIKPIERRLPPKGIDIGDAERDKLERRLTELDKAIAAAKIDDEVRPDVAIYTKAVRWALDFDEFYEAKRDIARAHAALDSAKQRLDALLSGKPLWKAQRGRVVRGYISHIDGSAQPYGLEIPDGLDLSGAGGKSVPLYVWLHGRNDKGTDLHFIAERQSKGCPISEFVDDGIILHPFGRHCVGFKGPGEIDVLDAIESVKRRYPIDENRIALLGFSMGGAGAWHIGAHYTDRFCVVHAGAGFAETAEYNRLKKEDYPPWYEQKLWGVYDVPCYTRNLFNVPVIAYSGEDDKQIQAARVMERAFAAEGRTLKHIIGPGTGHKYHPDSLKEIMAFVKAAVKKGRDRWPKEVHLQTRTLRYFRMHWLSVWRPIDQWEEMRADAERLSDNKIVITTRNVREFYIAVGPSGDESVDVVIDKQVIRLTKWDVFTGTFFAKDNGIWRVNNVPKTPQAIGKKWGPQAGPIDDAFMSPFLVVLPSGKDARNRVQRWINFELEHMQNRWRALYRADLPTCRDVDVTDEMIESRNLIVWGTPDSNRLIARMHDQLPIQWQHDAIVLNKRRFETDTHIAMMVCRTRLRETDRYIVLNSGPTFREGHDRTNSLQNPKLPDWAIVSLEKDPDAYAPGVIKAAGFFDENWKVKENEPPVDAK